MMNFSIIVPVYNAEEYLRECVNSLLGQTLDKIEIILIDDGSTDKSGIICDSLADEYKNITVIHQKNQGQSVARNVGIRAATGKYIMFVDSDDYIVSNSCETFFKCAEQSGADIVWGDMLNDKRNKARLEIASDSTVSTHEFLKKTITTGTYDIVPWIKIYRRTFILTNELFFFEGVFYEDQEFTLRLLLTDGLIKKIDFPFYYYRENASSTTHTQSLKKGMDCINVINRMAEDINSVCLNEETKQVAYNIVGMSVYHMSQVYLKMGKAERNQLQGLFDKRLRSYANKTELLPKRMQVQNKLFVFCPNLLVGIFEIKSLLCRR
ncbi:MAG: glycosyltransferase [Bacteroides thetaiotaomicron]|nr:glycosyltransferase [Bacteroides thetaiotaomicron]